MGWFSRLDSEALGSGPEFLPPMSFGSLVVINIQDACKSHKDARDGKRETLISWFELPTFYTLILLLGLSLAQL